MNGIRKWFCSFLGGVVLTLLWGFEAVGSEAPERTLTLADPTLFFDQGTYYLYGTGKLQGSPQEGFLVYTSQDLKTWKGPAGASEGFALKKGDAFGTINFWAPQVFRYQDRYYMAYAANEYIAIASAQSPLGPFKESELRKIPSDVRQIDPYLFFDDDGKIYFYHVRLDRGNRIFVAEMTPDLRDIKKETLRECIAAEGAPWENTNKQSWPVAEGPTVLKRNSTYYLFYSANDYRSPDYAVGYATSRSPLGPWKRYEGNPILHRSLVHENGTGHGDVLAVDEDKLLYVFHTHKSDTVVGPRRTALATMKTVEKDGETLFSIDPATFTFLKTK